MPNENSVWVLYGQHTAPTYIEDAGGGQELQRNAALKYVQSWRTCLDIGSNIGQWTRPLAKQFEKLSALNRIQISESVLKEIYRVVR